ncbi:MAG: hypothetical protein ACK5XN_34850, partial [Bacteroidota bacterium]
MTKNENALLPSKPPPIPHPTCKFPALHLHSKGIVARHVGIPANTAVAGVGKRHWVERMYKKELFFVLLRLSL